MTTTYSGVAIQQQSSLRDIKKTTDCGRTWDTVFIDNDPIEITAIAVDHYNTNIIYAATSVGIIHKKERSTYDADLHSQIKNAQENLGIGDLNSLYRRSETWEVM